MEYEYQIEIFGEWCDMGVVAASASDALAMAREHIVRDLRTPGRADTWLGNYSPQADDTNETIAAAIATAARIVEA